jgi:hypothetical protein
MTVKSLRLSLVLAALAVAIFASPSAARVCSWYTFSVPPETFGEWSCSDGCQALYVLSGGGWSLIDSNCGLPEQN